MKNVLIGGASRGIGAECVRQFALSGYNVVFTYKDSQTEAIKLSDETGAACVYCDFEHESSIRLAVAEARELLAGGIDVLVNCGAISQIRMFSDITTQDWNKMIAVNLSAPFYFIHAVLPDMIKKKSGRIINISSMWGVTGASCEVHYSASKAGLIGMTKALAKELGPSSITVNAVAPGVIDTDMNSHLTTEDMEDLTQEIPLCRIGTPREIARLILFIASEDSSYITGQVIGANGGMVI